MGRADWNRNYKKTERGRLATARAIQRYAQKNRDKATHYGKRYTEEDIEFILAIDKGFLSISEVSLIIGRNAGAVAQKLCELRSKMHEIQS